ncbi:MAG: cupredoxin family copper-binding protein [Candidatus Eremiobacteraeota bacterium]|nr:cupredoxin family copper-binding protein [Candidatus Eremiobacteraeota bacterium]
MNVLFLVLLAALGTGPAASPAGATATVHIKNFAYIPATLTVPAGTTVRFVNDDTEAHTVTATDRTFDSSGLDTGNAWTHRFVAVGKFPYFCELHPYMHGTVVVTASP